MSNIATVYSTLSKDCAVKYFMHYYMEREEKDWSILSYCSGSDKYIKMLHIIGLLKPGKILINRI